ncbi:MAG: ABC transporter transmembrane domain-containing protein, partial [Pseudomonadota bacterium]
MNTQTPPLSGPQRTALQAALDRCRTAFVAAALFSIFINALLLVVPLYSLQVFDRVLGSRSLDTLYLLTFVAVMLLGFQSLIDGVRMSLLGRIGQKLEEELRGPVLSSMVRDAARTRTTSAQSSRDLVEIRNALSSPVAYGFFDTPWAPLFLLVLFLLHPILGFVALGGALILIALAVGTILATRRLSEDAAREGIGSLESAQSFVQNAEVVQAMGMLPAIVRHWDHAAAGALSKGAQASAVQHRFTVASKFARMVLQVAAMGTGAALVLAGELTAGGMIA